MLRTEGSVAIVGAGMVGSYLHRILRVEGVRADMYGSANGHTACRIHPCAWGSSSGFDALVEAAGMDPDDYILMRPSRVNFEGVELSATLITFDKPRLIRDLQGGVEVLSRPIPAGRYDRVIDATGVTRALLPPIGHDLVIPCFQHRMRYAHRDSSVVMIKYGDIGYSWSFPLSEHEFHIGGGSLVLDPGEMLPLSGLLGDDGKAVCSCSGKVRATSPRMSQPFVHSSTDLGCEVWGVGEAIGVVAPIAGEGVVPGMASARTLLDSWDSPGKYTHRILRKFAWMSSERRILDKLLGGERLRIQDWITLRNTGRRMGAGVEVKDVMNLLRFLSKG